MQWSSTSSHKKILNQLSQNLESSGSRARQISDNWFLYCILVHWFLSIDNCTQSHNYIRIIAIDSCIQSYNYICIIIITSQSKDKDVIVLLRFCYEADNTFDAADLAMSCNNIFSWIPPQVSIKQAKESFYFLLLIIFAISFCKF